MTRSLIALANDSADPIESGVGLANEITRDTDGWVRLANYGEHPHVRMVRGTAGPVEERWVQILDKPDAVAAARPYSSTWQRLLRGFASIPLYVMHPDQADVAPEALANGGERIPVGTISRLDAREDGLYGQVQLMPAGETAVRAGKKRISLLWWVKPTGTTRPDGAREARVTGLISGGLVEQTQLLGAEALANRDARKPESTDHMKQLLLGLLAAHGVALANDATDDKALQAIIALLDKAKTDREALANAKTEVETKATKAEADLAAERNAVTSAKADAAAAREALANERKGRAEALVDLAIAQGRVAVAEREARITKLTTAADFAAEAKALANEAIRFKTTAASGAAGDRRGDANDTASGAQAQLISLANAAIKEGRAETFEQAWAATKATHPALHDTLRGQS